MADPPKCEAFGGEHMMKFYYTYVLQLANNDLYIGSCYDLKKRIIDHKSSRVKSTRNLRPVQLVYYEACLSKYYAIKREKQLKTGFGRGYIKKRVGL